MILRTIEIENFGLYAGRQVLDLVPRTQPGRETPVILFGGRNGAGKTTLLEAVRLALYGRRALGHRVGQSEYESHLRSRMHAGPGGNIARSASVGLEFDYAEGGVVQRYRVVRRWTAKGAKAVETLILEKDGKPVESVPRDEWHHFLQELIPPGVSQLFFFDGEKIAEIASDEVNDGLADAMRGLLGIELVGRLRTDLGLFMARRGKRENAETAARLEAIVREEAELSERIADAQELVAELTSRRLGQARLAANARQRFTAEGGDAANQRASLEASQSELKQQLARREAELREMAGGLLPFAMAPKLAARAVEELSRARGGTGAEAAALRERLLAWRGTGHPPRSAQWKDPHWRDLEAFLAADAATPVDQSGNPLDDMEASQRTGLLAQLREVRETTAAKAALLASELDRLGGRLREVEANLVRASGAAAGVILDELTLAEQQVGAIEAEQRARSEELKSLEFRRSNLRRERDRLLKSQADAEASEGRAALAGRIGQALQQYEKRLLDTKLSRLQREFVQRFNLLARKEGFVADVRIDSATFETVLIDRDGHEIPKAALSAGEKQVYAIAMLWALARTSGRALPMIIDTPLARLDSEHRAALVERYFPAASHQVIVLSTDTEVDEALLDRLMPAVSHTYRLDYDPDRRATVATPGYFDDEETANAVHQT
ncbi:DNA sulfur modification protein DndD [Sphingomonas naasensis]|uniref:DNA sulfur modification protein DndD n=1 Tax=Sphingomonas naasensis TaxID=1344951 RepID=A0A4S1WK89_9SPHN|nr:DNA sulfur modification protein DndD [Sphingomonas naasensis]NIJ22059.1 DNA sulfur modification protein DndD [Sphingomonas naasensis]TGX42267.1 DNA sulfur modification protein DndD [Sphingomonas naasensis]